MTRCSSFAAMFTGFRISDTTNGYRLVFRSGSQRPPVWRHAVWATTLSCSGSVVTCGASASGYISSFQQSSLLCLAPTLKVTPSHPFSVLLMITMYARLAPCNEPIGSAALSFQQTTGRLRQHPSQPYHIIMSSHELLSSSDSLSGTPWTWQPKSHLPFESPRRRPLNVWIACSCTRMQGHSFRFKRGHISIFDHISKVTFIMPHISLRRST